MPEPSFRERWHAYYSEKRIVHQWLQVDLLKDLEVETVLEIGPYLGCVTAMLASAGYRVTTLDIEPHSRGVGAERHIQADIRSLDPSRVQGFDAIVCCETLEHIDWVELDSVLACLSAARAKWLIISVPYEAFQFRFNLYVNRYRLRRNSSFRKLRFLKRFPSSDDVSWEPHKWEIGYRGYALSALMRKLSRAGLEPVRREFTSGCRSVFLVCRNASARALEASG